MFGAVSVVLSVAHPDQTIPGALASPLWTPVHLIGAALALAGLVGWLGLFARYGDVFGRARAIALIAVVLEDLAGGTDQLIEAILPGRAQNVTLGLLSPSSSSHRSWVPS